MKEAAPEYAVRANEAATALRSLYHSADGRPLTATQRKDAAGYQRAVLAAFDQAPTSSQYMRSVRDQLGEPGEVDDTTPQLAEELAKLLKFEALREAGDAFRGTEKPVIERASGRREARDEDLFTVRALAGDVVDGSNVIAKEYADIVWSRLYDANPLLRAGLTEFETTDYSFILPIGTASVTVTIAGQGTAISPTDPGFTQQEIIPQRFGALTAVSNEFWADISGPQRSYILNDHVKAISDSLETEMLSGNGSPGFTGLYGTTAAGTVTGGTVTAIGLSPYAQALGTAAANNITPTHWIVSPSDYGQLVKITEGGTAAAGSLRPLLTPTANAGGAVSTSLFGYPVLVTPNAAAGTALLISAPELIFVKRTNGVEQFIDPYSLSNTYQTRLRTVVRAGFHALAGRFVRIASLA